jgi:hypothetical protein
MEEEKKHDSTELPESPSPQYVAGAPSTYIKPQGRKPHDPDVTFEEYHYYAHKTREEEKNFVAPKTDWKEIVLRKKKAHDDGNGASGAPLTHELTGKDFSDRTHRLEISDEEWTNASRAFRTASWGACE